jgi:hypothetical protein
MRSARSESRLVLRQSPLSSPPRPARGGLGAFVVTPPSSILPPARDDRLSFWLIAAIVTIFILGTTLAARRAQEEQVVGRTPIDPPAARKISPELIS